MKNSFCMFPVPHNWAKFTFVHVLGVLKQVHIGEPISNNGFRTHFRHLARQSALSKCHTWPFLCPHFSRKDRTKVHQHHFGIAGNLFTAAAAVRNFLLLAPLWLSLVKLERPSSRPPPVSSPHSLSEVELLTVGTPSAGMNDTLFLLPPT